MHKESLSGTENNPKRVIAIYLPQFHPFKENDEWWGKGFTEWTNVSKARPRFPGHYQPQLPADLGFYDLRVPEVREQQAEMAREAGIYGFCYYHYWFNGKLLMERPLREVLESGKPDFPFMICWANENWTRAWNGAEKQVLISQEYGPEDARNHIKWLMPYLKDPRYIRIAGKPVVAIYRTTKIPDLQEMLKIWRDEAAKEGLELYICRFESFAEAGEQYLVDGLDAAIDFQPTSRYRVDFQKQATRFFFRAFDIWNSILFRGIFPQIINYKKYVRFMETRRRPAYKCFPCVTPGWDNSARKKRGSFMFVGNTPQLYGRWLRDTLNRFDPWSEEENLVFINAWNEWAEGNHLEPDQKWGKAFLLQTKEAVFLGNQ